MLRELLLQPAGNFEQEGQGSPEEIHAKDGAAGEAHRCVRRTCTSKDVLRTGRDRLPPGSVLNKVADPDGHGRMSCICPKASPPPEMNYPNQFAGALGVDRGYFGHDSPYLLEGERGS
jgi:hypothetical protein